MVVLHASGKLKVVPGIMVLILVGPSWGIVEYKINVKDIQYYLDIEKDIKGILFQSNRRLTRMVMVMVMVFSATFNNIPVI